MDLPGEEHPRRTVDAIRKLVHELQTTRDAVEKSATDPGARRLHERLIRLDESLVHLQVLYDYAREGSWRKLWVAFREYRLSVLQITRPLGRVVSNDRKARIQRLVIRMLACITAWLEHDIALGS